MKDQILALHSRGIGKRKIASMLGISKNTVKGVIRVASSPVAPIENTGPIGAEWTRLVAWEEVQREIGKKYVTIKALHKDYAPEGVTYLRFWRELQKRFPGSLEDVARVRFQYKAGERVEIDYCDGIPIIDPKSGSKTVTHLFCAVSSHSDYVYAEFVLTQKREDFIASQDRMYQFFGGVFKYAVIDNLKSGVHLAHQYDPDINPVYVDYANHMGFAVLPARPVTPRDKPAIEASIGVIQRQFYAEVRNRVFHSLYELNTVFREYLKQLNLAIMKDYGVSRSERFAKERAMLAPLPSGIFEIAEYREVSQKGV